MQKETNYFAFSTMSISNGSGRVLARDQILANSAENHSTVSPTRNGAVPVIVET
jgi:hypothetical protein